MTSGLVQQAADAVTGGNISHLAKLINTPLRTVRHWMAVPSAMSGATVILLRLLIERPQVAKWIAAAEGPSSVTLK